MKEIKENSSNKFYIYSLCLYIATLFIFAHDIKLVIISEIAFLIFSGAVIINILNKKRFKFHSYYLVFAALFFISTISILWTVDKELAIIRNFTLFQLIILTFLVYNSINDEIDINLCLKSMAISGLGMCLYALYFYGIDYIIISARYGIRLGGEINQANAFGYYSALTFILFIYYTVFSKKKIYFIVSIIPLFFSILSGSRRSILIIVIGILGIMIIFNRMKKRNIILVLFVPLLIILISYFINLLQDIDIFSRFNYFINFLLGKGEVDNSILTRKQMIDFGLELFKERPILGYGTNQYSALYNLHHGGYKASHNGYIQVLVNHGIAGFILYYGMYFYIIKELLAISKKGENPLGGILLIIMALHLASDIATESIYDKFSYILLGVSFAFIRLNRCNKNRKKLEGSI